MRRVVEVAVSVCLVFGLAASAMAQSAPSHGPLTELVEPLSPEQHRELAGWLSAMERWRRYDARYSNRPARDTLGRIVERRSPPAPPAWLTPYCAAAGRAGAADLEDRTARACRLLADPRAGADPVRVQAQAARDAAEKPDTRSSFLTRLHIDGLGISTASGPRIYGIVGSHISLVDVGRVQIFGPPGVLVLSVPDVGGRRRMSLGYTWGLSVRLADVRLMRTRDMTLFLTFSKLWVNGNGDSTAAAGELQIVSLSLAPRKRR